LVFGRTSPLLLPRFLLFYLVLTLANVALLEALTALDVGPLWAQAILLPFLAATGFLGMRRFVFGQSEPEQNCTKKVWSPRS
jgi:hypothetical protein